MGSTLQPSFPSLARFGACGTARTTFAELRIKGRALDEPKPGLVGIVENVDINKFDSKRCSQVVGLPRGESDYAYQETCIRLHLSAAQIVEKAQAHATRAIERGERTEAEAREHSEWEIDYHSGRHTTLRNDDGTFIWFEYRFDRWVSKAEFERLHGQAVAEELDPTEVGEPRAEGAKNAWYEMSVRERRVTCLGCDINSSMSSFEEGRALARGLSMMSEDTARKFLRQVLGLELLRHQKRDLSVLTSERSKEILKYLTGPTRPALASILHAELCDDDLLAERVKEFGFDFRKLASEADRIGDCETSYSDSQMHGLLVLLNQHGNFELLQPGSPTLSGGADISVEEAQALLEEIKKAEQLLEMLQVPGIEILGRKMLRESVGSTSKEPMHVLARIPQSDATIYGNPFGGYGIELVAGQQFITILKCPALLASISSGDREAMKAEGPSSLSAIHERIRGLGEKLEVTAIHKNGERFVALLRNGEERELPPIHQKDGGRETILDAFANIVPLNSIVGIRFAKMAASSGYGDLLRELRRVVETAATRGFSLHIR